ncbi:MULTISPECIES: DUF29 family protein [Moorena]|uniref:DUF29 domain-containing protein n=1 Tax=Moorena producens PAL-8-15-08-1 TaxID=1458985 RepID=A0A1D8TUN6_9CYAN|nr:MULTISPECIES: DUF29 family protein [Moorena]AOX01358.1 hypothetical protein BJP34_19650 [Moorena producens PAL-8-15-08-1]NEO16588.1 DUF29 domain-containing protein [Moorena sp. SIO3E8]NEQ03106.1 DUF29 domain-containing protein [Moorena sp. SIO3F7]
MTQELIDLRISILEGRYADALAIVDELEQMSKRATLHQIESYLNKALINLIKNQVEERLANSWAASIRDFIREIQKLNLKDNQKSYTINADQWQSLIDNELEAAISTASVEVLNGAYTPVQLSKLVDRAQLRQTTQDLLALTYLHSKKDLPLFINDYLTKLPGGSYWNQDIQL